VNLVTPLNRVLGLGSAKGGVEHWWVQRLSAVALVALGLWLAVALGSLEDYTFATVITWASRPVTSILLILTVLTATYHSHLGVQVVLEDYIHSPGRKTAAIVLSTFAHFVLAIAGIFSIARIAFGSLS
jgi:succinate dehydrogenase / fumarate reductase membrane anchor subunit